MAVGIYVRVSTEEQRERQSIVTQTEFASKYCDLHHWTVFQVYADDGVSGTIPLESRPAGARMLDDARRGKFDQLLIYRVDRIGRDARGILNAVAKLEDCGVRVSSLTESFNTATPEGRLMLTMLSGFAAHERELIRERSMAGSNRLAEAGAWLGGIVPYGYRKEGERAQARILVNEDPIPGFETSEAEIVRTIYRLNTEQKLSCVRIADHLNGLGIPCGPVFDGSGPGKRKRKVAAFWRPGHVRNIIASSTYKGQHAYGKRSANRNRKVIVRAVPAIVSEQTWETAQQVLRSNYLFSRRNSKNCYLLRGLIRCSLCGARCTGWKTGAPQSDFYYRCNNKILSRGRFSLSRKRCESKALNGDYIERLVWADIEAFLRDPGDVLEKLRARLSAQDGDGERKRNQVDSLQARLREKSEERERILGLFRRGRIDEATLDKQLDEIEKESAGTAAELDRLTQALSAADRTVQLANVESLLSALRARLDGPIPSELKRAVVEVMVESIEANTVERFGVQCSEITINYRFSEPTQPAALVLPKEHQISNRHHLPDQLNTIGDHIRRRRLERKLLQGDVAKEIGVNKASITNWEKNHTKPSLEYMPAIIRFLRYSPMADDVEGWGARLVQHRTEPERSGGPARCG